MDATRADTKHDEARRELSSMLGPAKLGGIASELLVDHLLAAYADAGWPVLRDAARALLRRIASTEREHLRVTSRPARQGCRGRYQTGRKRRQARPYTTTVYAVRPLHVACDCLDYQQGSLGICKHGIAVLRDVRAASGDASAELATPPQQAPSSFPCGASHWLYPGGRQVLGSWYLSLPMHA
jgi:hypothetical protein